jgi:hypothetical protein
LKRHIFARIRRALAKKQGFSEQISDTLTNFILTAPFP